jgi:hypothetical protein
MEFMIDPFDPEDESLDILWTLDGDSITDRSWTFINLDSSGFHQVAVYVSDSTESDSMTWNIDVSPNLIELTDLNLLPDTPTLYPPSPNPFNSSTTIRYALPVSGQVKMYLFDISGRLVTEIINQNEIVGWHNVVISGNNLVSGVYLVRMIVGGEIYTRKALLLK